MPSSTLPNKLPTKKPKLIIFDLDGTLYDQRPLRKRMLLMLAWHIITFRLSITGLKIIRCFRKEREKRLGYQSDNLDAEQYEWCAFKLKIPSDQVQQCVEKWMYTLPLKHLYKAKFAGVDNLFDTLNKQNIRTVVYSDYPVEDKLRALGLKADKSFSSTNKELNQLKPSKASIKYICKNMQCEPRDCLYIGDRADTDGKGAILADIPFILVNTTEARKGIFYNELSETLLSTQ